MEAVSSIQESTTTSTSIISDPKPDKSNNYFQYILLGVSVFIVLFTLFINIAM